jgi:Fe-S cluster biogenesis protein NfuA
MSEANGALLEVMRNVVEPLVRADGGELFVAELTPTRVVLHLRGRFAGCPGNSLVIRRVIKPALMAVAPACSVSVSFGELLPHGARPFLELDSTAR